MADAQTDPPDPNSADRQAAHRLLTELRTRIATQPLPYQHGVEERALESLFEVFAHAREAIKDNPGCELFARETTAMLNVTLRPVTAKWHRAREEGVLRSRDGGDEFRGDLRVVQQELRGFAARLAEIAYGEKSLDDLVPGVLTQAELETCLAPLPGGIPADPETNGGIAPASVEAINQDEAAAIRGRRAARDTEAPVDAVGLAFSGGGIRSATFCLGVTQVLAERKLLGDVDYLSTVSGGGYTGCFVTTQLARGTEPADLGAPRGPDTRPIKELRRYADFLVSRKLLGSWRMVLETLLGMLFNWLVPLIVLAVVAGVAVLWTRHCGDLAGWIALGAAALLPLMGIAFFGLERGKRPGAAVPGVVMLVCSLALVAVLCAWALEAVFYWAVPISSQTLAAAPGRWSWQQLTEAWNGSPLRAANWSLTGLGGIGSVALLVPVVLRYLPLLEKPRVRRIAVTLSLLIAALVVPVLAVAIVYVLFALGAVCVGPDGSPIGLLGLGAGIALLTAVVLLFLNINTTGPHRIYRRGLSRTFVDRDKRKAAAEELALFDEDNRAPYHLLNATANLPTSREEQLRERRCDFFLFSRRWTGSPAVGYAKTEKWRMDGRAPDLATAMAVSGAAFSSSMGLGSFAPLRALLTFLNVRLGYWQRRPYARAVFQHPGFLCLLREMTGRFMSEKERWINLSDGGHIENLAVYELLRRRCKFVVCVDGEADPDHRFHGLMTLVRHAQIDLGVAIAPNLTDLRPDPETGYCRSHYHFCRIRYPEGTLGLLLYLKLSVTGNESELIQRYRHFNPSFPHQTTLDQFFDEEQFEAYRQLGVHVAEGLFSSTLMNGQPDPATVREWFTRLAGNLLTPE